MRRLLGVEDKGIKIDDKDAASKRRGLRRANDWLINKCQPVDYKHLYRQVWTK
jgi:hypothetical protein